MSENLQENQDGTQLKNSSQLELSASFLSPLKQNSSLS